MVFELATGDYLFDPKASDEYPRDEAGRCQLQYAVGWFSMVWLRCAVHMDCECLVRI